MSSGVIILRIPCVCYISHLLMKITSVNLQRMYMPIKHGPKKLRVHFANCLKIACMFRNFATSFIRFAQMYMAQKACGRTILASNVCHILSLTTNGDRCIKKCLISPLSLVLGVQKHKTIYGKSWPANLLQVLTLTFYPFIKVELGYQLIILKELHISLIIGPRASKYGSHW